MNGASGIRHQASGITYTHTHIDIYISIRQDPTLSFILQEEDEEKCFPTLTLWANYIFLVAVIYSNSMIIPSLYIINDGDNPGMAAVLI